MIQARMYVQQVTQYAGSLGRQVVLNAATRGEENKTWAAATPAATLTMTVKNDDAIFELGKDYRVTFEIVEPD